MAASSQKITLDFWRARFLYAAVFGLIIWILSAGALLIGRMNRSVFFFSLIVFLFAAILCWKKMRKFFLIENAVPETNGRFIPVFPSVIFDFVILITAFLVRTDAGISSPWDVMPWGVFIFFGAASFFLLFFFSKLSAFARWLAISVHAAATYWIALITYRLGFGFDPFIHQAAERVLAEHGSALSGILYAGQYAGVLVLHWISHLSITWLDRLLVPCFGLFGILFIA
ncbi:MAG TPA: hypothetical protein VFQ60_04380, partial [Patescibacteria group bacterium]|nr:hypothetical protein [Patescibacteria group bacterium]